MKILTLDIETSPNLAHVWGIWQQNVGLPQLLESTEVLCWAAKWYGEDEILFSSSFGDGKAEMVVKMWRLLDEADVVVHYNGQKFDIPHLNREFLELDMTPPSPFKQVDLLKTSKNQFRFPSNKLDYIVQELGLGQKVKHAGHKLWVDCLMGDPKAWAKMEEYNREDVVITEKLYDRYLPWIKGVPNAAVYLDETTGKMVCPGCGSIETIKEGYAYTNLSKFQQYKCKDCGKWFRGRENMLDREGLGANIT